MSNLRNNERYNLSNKAVLISIEPRVAEYWSILEVSRHLGFYKPKSDEGFWVARFRSKDQRYFQKRIGCAFSKTDTCMSYEEAVKKAQEWFNSKKVSSIASDRIPVGATQTLLACPIGEVFTIGYALNTYVEWKKISSQDNHIQTVLSLINHHIVPEIFDLPAYELKGKKLRDFCIKILKSPPKRGNGILLPEREIGELSVDELRKRKGTLNKLLSILRTALKMSWENGDIDDQRVWVRIHRLPNLERPRNIILSRGESRQLLNVCRSDLKNLVLAALYTGCRASELSRLRVRDIGNDIFGIHIECSKSNNSRYVFLPDEGMAFFLNLIEGKASDDRVFLNIHGKIWNRSYIGLFKKAVLAAKLPKELVFHGLRHTYASELIMTGASMLSVAQQLGHSTIDCVVKTYGHLSPEFREREIGKYFRPLISTNYKTSKLQQKMLRKTKDRQLHTSHRGHGEIEQASSWPKTTFSRADGELLSLIRGL